MKSIKLLSVLLVVLMIFGTVACNGNEAETTEAEKSEVSVYTVKCNGINIELGKNAEDVLEELGEPQSSNYVASCGENMGEQWVYSYSSLLVYTLKDGDKEIIDAVKLRDDTGATTKGIRLGKERSDVIDAYGDKYTEDNGRLLYTNGTYVIEFSLDDTQKVSGIEMRTESK